jgi:RNA polymerase sigma factor (sigma-70 family)
LLASEGWHILQEHGPAAHAVLLRLTLRHDVAEDLLHDLFVKLVNHVARADDPAAYMCRAAINLAMDWRRKQAKRPVKMSPPGEQHEPGRSLEQAEDINRILDAAEHLSDLERQVFVLRFVMQESHERIAQMLQKTPQQSRGLCDAVVKHIRKNLGERQVARGRA